jgi:hypothetical protein
MIEGSKNEQGGQKIYKIIKTEDRLKRKIVKVDKEAKIFSDIYSIMTEDSRCG